MPELTCNLRIGPACSEPVQLSDGQILVACETPARDAIHVYSLMVDESIGALALPIAMLPGGPTDNGTRAQWPRTADNGTVAYQRGTQNVVIDVTGVWQSRGDGSPGRSYGVWPVVPAGRAATGLYYEAPLTTSQGVFGYFASRWWTYDEMRESGYQQDWVRLGTLSHAWNDREWRFFLYKHESGTVWRAEGPGTSGMPMRVFSGQAEYPRGCTLQDGRILVTAVGPRVREASPGVWEHQLRVAVSPFEKFESEPTPMPNIRVDDWSLTPVSNTVPAAINALVTLTDGADIQQVVIKQIRRKGFWDDWITESRTGQPKTSLQVFTVADPGTYEWRCGLTTTGPFTSTREFTVSAPPVPEPPPSQVVTFDEAYAVVMWKERFCSIADDLSYTAAQNARCAGLDHRAALIAYRDAVSLAIAQLEVG